MPSVVKNMVLDTETLVTEKRNAKVKPSFIMIDNVLAGADSQLIFQDVFTTDASTVAATGVADGGGVKIIPRLRINVSVDACVSLRDELKDIEFLGEAKVERRVAPAVLTPDPNCHITLGYDLQ